MPWTTNPTFADGNVLTATQLNVLSSNCEFLYSLVSGVNHPFTGENLTVGGTSRTYTFRRQSRYLHYKFRLTSGDSDEVILRIDGNTEYNDATNRASPYTWSSYIDLDVDVASPPAVGDFYEVTVEIAFNPNGEFHLDYFIESDSTTL